MPGKPKRAKRPKVAAPEPTEATAAETEEGRVEAENRAAEEKKGRDRRASRRNPIQVRLDLSDARGRFTGRSVDVSRGGIFAATTETRAVGTLLRIRVLGPRGETVLAVGVVVRCFADLEASGGGASPGLAIALTSTSEGWDRFWDDVTATDDLDDEDDLEAVLAEVGAEAQADDDDDDGLP